MTSSQRLQAASGRKRLTLIPVLLVFFGLAMLGSVAIGAVMVPLPRVVQALVWPHAAGV